MKTVSKETALRTSTILDDDDDSTTPPPPPAGGNVDTPKANTGGTKKAKSTLRDDLYAEAVADLAGEGAVDFSAYGSKSHTLEFIKPIGRESVKSSYTDRAKVSHTSPDVIGGRFVSTEPLSVPVVPATMTPETGVDLTQVTYREVAAGEQFDITLMEAVVLLTRDEFAMTFNYKGQAGVAALSARFTEVGSGAKLPTAFFFVSKVQIKADQIVIDHEVDGKWVVKEEFERFAPFVVNGSNSNSSGSRSTAVPPTTKNTLAYRKLLGNLGGAK